MIEATFAKYFPGLIVIGEEETTPDESKAIEIANLDLIPEDDLPINCYLHMEQD